MKYEQHNFVENIQSAIKAEDNTRVLDILMAEIGAMLSKNRNALIKAVRDSGKEIPDNISDSDLTKTIVNGVVATNKTFLNNLVTILIKENEQYHNDISGVGSLLSGIGNIVGGIANAAAAGIQSKAEVTAAREGVKAAQANLQASKESLYGKILDAKAATDTAKYGAEAVKTQAKSNSQTIITVSIVVGVLALTGALAYVIFKQHQTNQAAGAAQ